MRERYIGAYAPVVFEGFTYLVRKTGGPYIGSWDLPGGGLEFGESPEDALRREFQEEIGLTIERADLDTVLSCQTTYTRPDGVTVDFHHIGILFHHIGILYRVTFLHPPSIGTDPAEEAAPFPLASLPSLSLTPFARASFLTANL